MPFTPTAKNNMLEAERSILTVCSLHSTDPGTTGAGELTGGTYARVAVTAGAAANGEMFVNNAPVLNVPPSATVAYVGFWSGVGGTVFRGSSIVATEVYSAAGGTYTVLNTTRFDLNG